VKSLPLPPWVRLLLAPNPGPLTLDGTNTWLLAGLGGGAVVVDPGPDDAGHLEAVSAAEPELVLLTHGHADHAAGADRLHARTGAPVRAVDPSRCRGAPALADGDRVAVGGVQLTVLHTPGHSSDSACLVVRHDRDQLVCTGDTVLGRGTAVVVHPDGRLADYLATLRRLQALGRHAVLPGHGPALPDLSQVAGDYLAHREQRLEQVRRAVADGLTEPADLVRAVYPEVGPELADAAELSVRAQLEYLGERGE
jgi:glyoxylase-like metal-dependent hydrolase (beta-lactamase superfamily II)